MNRIKAGTGNPDPEMDNIVFFDEGKHWPQRLYEQVHRSRSRRRGSTPRVVLNYNIGFLFASGPFTSARPARRERFSLALAYGADLTSCASTVKLVQQIYNANYQFAVPPPDPTVHAEVGDGYVRLTWDDVAERGIDPVTRENDFEGYRIYRSTDPEFRDPQVITTGRGTGPSETANRSRSSTSWTACSGYSQQVVEGVAYWLGDDTGLTHTWIDTTVTNGQKYYYAVCAYDYGRSRPTRSLSIRRRTPSRSRARRAAGRSCPKNVVAVRPNPRVSASSGIASDGDAVGGTGHRHRAGRGRQFDAGSGRPSVQARLQHASAGQRPRRLLRPDGQHDAARSLFTSGYDLRRRRGSAGRVGLLPVVQHADTCTSTRLGIGLQRRTATRTCSSQSEYHRAADRTGAARLSRGLRDRVLRRRRATRRCRLRRCRARPAKFHVIARDDTATSCSSLPLPRPRPRRHAQATAGENHRRRSTYRSPRRRPTPQRRPGAISLDTAGPGSAASIPAGGGRRLRAEDARPVQRG